MRSEKNSGTAFPNTEILSPIKELLISYSPEELEDMLFHLFEDANLSEGDLNRDEKIMRHDFHLACRSILRNLSKDPESLSAIKNL
ncbi:hypothetical protein [Chryseobacterium oncorhynchi]|uniref:Uncharacterized protein n=1 Tax=Chryseobacterium oncorhynchi TaxID=741074 RepID=A0A316X8F4_9FLAO|nr:hypothetical protein [Chryseobacterium oncorhynchi]PWN67598.1 hypothetical protein C1638_003130 [Chryseobacterium oncorhynchi]